MSDKTIIDWIPNETSKKALRKALGDDTEDWIGKGAEFKLVEMMVGGELKDVIYVKE